MTSHKYHWDALQCVKSVEEEEHIRWQLNAPVRRIITNYVLMFATATIINTRLISFIHLFFVIALKLVLLLVFHNNHYTTVLFSLWTDFIFIYLIKRRFFCYSSYKPTLLIGNKMKISCDDVIEILNHI